MNFCRENDRLSHFLCRFAYMKILTGREIKEADLRTIENGPVLSLDLMERAAVALTDRIVAVPEYECRLASSGRYVDYVVFAGRGNNGGDGLAIARLLCTRSHVRGKVSVVTVGYDGQLSADCRANYDRLPSGVAVYGFGSDGKDLPPCLFGDDVIIIDALLGTGVNGDVREPVRSAIAFINSVSGKCHRVFSIDMPSGMPTEPEDFHDSACRMTGAGQEGSTVLADVTFTIEFPKLSLLLPRTGKCAGRTEVVHIGLDKDFIMASDTPYMAVDADMIRQMLMPRDEFAHKGTYGHVLVIAGSSGMMGAAVLCTGAALKSGCGLVTAHIPWQERTVMHVAQPSAIVSGCHGPAFSSLPDDMSKYSAYAAGPGLGQRQETSAALKSLLQSMNHAAESDAGVACGRTIVLDADALNIIASHPELLPMIPPGAVLTPHEGELARLVVSALPGCYPWKNDMQKMRAVCCLSKKLDSVIVVKGAHTMTCAPDGRCYFNMTGNPGMAKGGSGDVLTGLIAGLAARGYSPLQAALLGVWYHGCAGDRAAEEKGQESMNASDILACIRIGLNRGGRV